MQGWLRYIFTGLPPRANPVCGDGSKIDKTYQIIFTTPDFVQIDDDHIVVTHPILIEFDQYRYDTY